MSTSTTPEQIADLISGYTELKQYFETIRASLEADRQQLRLDVDNYLAGASGEVPLLRVSPDQYGNLDADVNNLQGWRKNGFNIDVSLHRQINSGTPWDERDAEEQEILTAMGMPGKQHFSPSIRVLRMTWSGKNSHGNYDADSNAYTIYPEQIPVQQSYTTACYAKLISGEILGHFLGDDIELRVNSEWGLCGGSHRGRGPGSYVHAHPYARSDSGEVLFIWPAVVQGYMRLDRNQPQWRWFPHQSATLATDVSV